MRLFQAAALATLIVAPAALPLDVSQAQPSVQENARAVAVTFDDLPARGDLATMRDTTVKLLGTLVREHVPTTGFINEVKLFVGNQTDARTALLEAWLDAGFDLGNHTYCHVATGGSRALLAASVDARQGAAYASGAA